ncbi:MAG: hypothetical protein FWF52_09380 [Candidatus Azobacteroides sp.]|nr:hypothetical protein [Candidatus Azobacteroides sp.]
MKKQTSLFFLFFAIFYSSCINHDYDLDNDTIDKNVVVSPEGMNMPFGNVEKIFIYEKIGYDDIRVAGDGSLYIEYEGDLDNKQFKVPNYNIDSIDPINTSNISIQLPTGISTIFDFSSFSGNVPLLEGETIGYEVTKPIFESENWTINPNQIIFDSFTINLKFILQGFSNVNGSAKVNLYLTFPDNFEIEGETLDAKGRIIRTIDFNKTSNTYSLPKGIEVKSYKYPANGRSDIRFDLDFGAINGFKGNVNNPSFQLTFITDNDRIAIQSVNGQVTGKESIQGEINGFEALKSSFGEDAKLQFENPSLFLNVTTNLGANFYLNIDKIDAHNGQSISLDKNDGLLFTKPTSLNTQKTTSYFIAPLPDQGAPAGATGKKLALDELFSSIPEKISYEFSMNVDEPNAILAYSNLILQGNYKFTLPFDFEDLKIHVRIPPINLGEDVYGKFFHYVKDAITIQADTVIISAEKINPLLITATLQFLDAEQQAIEISKKSVALAHGLNKDTFAIDFSKQDLDNMQNARYLNIEFTVEGKGSLTQNDYIDIRGLRFISDGGIHYELNL